jgi:hypothetical protein
MVPLAAMPMENGQLIVSGVSTTKLNDEDRGVIKAILIFSSTT